MEDNRKCRCKTFVSSFIPTHLVLFLLLEMLLNAVAGGIVSHSILEYLLISPSPRTPDSSFMMSKNKAQSDVIVLNVRTFSNGG